MSFSRAERRREEAKRRARVDPACPVKLIRDIDVALATAIIGRHKVCAGESVGDIVRRVCPAIFGIAEREGFVLSFALPENTIPALARGVIAYAVKRPLN